MTTWNEELRVAREVAGDKSKIVAIAPSEEAMDVEFDGGFGLAEGPPVLVWTEARVYFPVVYDGAEWLGSAPRYPQEDGQKHVGGG